MEEVPQPWERLLWRERSLLRRRFYALTDVRLVRIDGDRYEEIVLADIGDVHAAQSRIDRLTRRATVVVHSHRHQRPAIVLAHVRRGAQLAALLELLAGEPTASLERDAVDAALAWEPQGPGRTRHRAVAAAAGLAVAAAAAMALHGRLPAVTSVAYSPTDAIYPNGVKRDPAAITAFMEKDVMPWARQTLGPLAGGADRVTCDTCHGRRPDTRDWRMPAVAALPAPDVVGRGWETYGGSMNAQMRNAIYGYLAESDNQAKAAYMREVVMPGMARLLGRPAYDFTRTYEFNRARNSFGCYHCHQVREGDT